MVFARVAPYLRSSKNEKRLSWGAIVWALMSIYAVVTANRCTNNDFWSSLAALIFAPGYIVWHVYRSFGYGGPDYCPKFVAVRPVASR